MSRDIDPALVEKAAQAAECEWIDEQPEGPCCAEPSYCNGHGTVRWCDLHDREWPCIGGAVLAAVLPDVRRAVAEEIAAAIRARAGRDMVLTHEAAADTAAIALHIGAGLLEVRIAREAGERDE